jgi:hypothetical protein
MEHVRDRLSPRRTSQESHAHPLRYTSMIAVRERLRNDRLEGLVRPVPGLLRPSLRWDQLHEVPAVVVALPGVG